MSLDRMLAKLVAGVAEKSDAQELETHLWSGTKWVRGQKDEGKVDAGLEDIAAALIPAAVNTGLIDEQRARRQVERGWSSSPGGRPGKLRQVQHSVTATAQPMDVRQSVDLLLAVFSDARLRNKIAAIILDALEVFEISKSPKPGDAA